MNKFRRIEIRKSLDAIEKVESNIKKTFIDEPCDNSMTCEEIKEEVRDIASDISSIGNYTLMMLEGMFENSIHYDKVENEADVLLDASDDLYDIVDMMTNAEDMSAETANKMLKSLSKIYDNVQEII